MKKTVIHNFQRGTTGRDEKGKSIAIISRTKDKSLTYHVRCDADRKTKACKVALALVQAAQARLSHEPDDSGKTRKIVKKKFSHKGD